jgi:hypothetical protein
MPECGRESQDYNEVMEIGLMFALLSITAVDNADVPDKCTRTENLKSPRQGQWNPGRCESR